MVSFFFVDRGADLHSSFWDAWLGNVAEIAPVAFLGVATAFRRRNRLVWIMFLLGASLNVVGRLAELRYGRILPTVPASGVGIISYLLSYLCFVMGAAALAYRAAQSHASLTIEGVIAGLSASSVFAAVFFRPVTGLRGAPLSMIVNLSYLMLDLIFLTLVIGGLAPRRYRPTSATFMLILGGVVLTIGDAAFLTRGANNAHHIGTVMDAHWVIAITLFAAAAWAPQQRGNTPTNPATLTVATALFAMVALVVLGCAPFVRMPSTASLLALGALGMVLVRGLLAVRELRSAQESHRLANTDELTGLPNRRHFTDYVKEVMHEGSGGFALLMIDLDGFKDVNDTLGHQVGDDLLRHVAQRFRRALPADGFLARLGGDEFGGYLPVGSLAESEEVARNLLAVFRQPVALDGFVVHASASIGIATYPTDGTDQVELLRCADIAMYYAKKNRLGVSDYRSVENPATRASLELVEDFRRAVDRNELSVHFQPIMHVLTGVIERVEALARWEHPTRGLIMPDVFVPLAEQSDLIFVMTRSILELSCSEVAAYRKRTGRSLGVGINISARDLCSGGIVEMVAETCARHDLPPQAVTLEITETALTSDPVRAALGVKRLRALGVHVSIDDFGVGYSSMSQLLDLAVDELKLDKGFVIPMEHDSRAAAIVTATIELSRALGLSLIAEGVESAEILSMLAKGGCDFAQGFFISRPATLTSLEGLLSGSLAPMLRPAIDV